MFTDEKLKYDGSSIKNSEEKLPIMIIGTIMATTVVIIIRALIFKFLELLFFFFLLIFSCFLDKILFQVFVMTKNKLCIGEGDKSR